MPDGQTYATAADAVKRISVGGAVTWDVINAPGHARRFRISEHTTHQFRTGPDAPFIPTTVIDAISSVERAITNAGLRIRSVSSTSTADTTVTIRVEIPDEEHHYGDLITEALVISGIGTIREPFSRVATLRAQTDAGVIVLRAVDADLGVKNSPQTSPRPVRNAPTFRFRDAQ